VIEPPLASALLAAVSAVSAVAAGASVDAGLMAPPAERSRRSSRWATRLAAGASARGRRRLEVLIAGAHAPWSVEEVLSARRLALAALVIVTVVAPAVTPITLALTLPVARGPEIALAKMAKRRSAAARRELPLFLDLLSVATSAGLAPQLAVRRAAEPLEGPLGDELRRALRATDLGRRWRDELRTSAEHAALADLSRAVELLVRTERLGSSLADEMVRLAADVRQTRRARATERARAAPVKMLFPLVFLILPAFLLLTVVPVLLTTVRSIG
jgi:pilus assembly protein TadC